MVEIPREITGIMTDRREQVGPTDITDEQGVAGEHAEGLALRAVGTDDHADRFGGVPGGLEDLEVDGAEGDVITVRARLDGETHPTSSGLSVDDVGSSGIGQLEMARQEIGVEVRLDHLGDAQTVRLGIAEVLGDVALRIDHDRLTGLGVADEIARVRQAVQVVLGEEQ